ncbi:MFS family permease [Nonomuraea soli]|uniref:MFS family permease n=1 Tax=Nonomuraea soli TaxID=1032476 RepID=A0A7W0CLS5_9ACTN|nr:MFS family permease [Nonomuraea soli]
MSTLAIPLIAGLLLNASPMELGLLTAARKAPVLFASLPAGALADRWRKRPIMIWSLTLSGLIMLTLPLAAMAGALTIGHLWAVALLAGICEVFYSPAYQTYPLLILGPERIMQGNARLTTTITVSGMSGPALSGVLIALLGPAKAVLVDAASFLAAAATMAFIRTPEPKPQPRDRSGLRREIAEGLRYVVRHPVIGPLLFGMATISFCLAGTSALEITYLARELGWSSQALGLVLGVGMLGGLAGGMLAEPLTSRYGTARVLIGAALAYPLFVSPIGLIGPGLAGQIVMGVSWGLLLVAAIVFQSVQKSLRQLLTPAEMQGRLAASARWITWGATPLGALLAGALATWAGMRGALLVFAAGLFAGPVVMWRIRTAIAVAVAPRAPTSTLDGVADRESR